MATRRRARVQPRVGRSWREESPHGRGPVGSSDLARTERQKSHSASRGSAAKSSAPSSNIPASPPDARAPLEKCKEAAERAISAYSSTVFGHVLDLLHRPCSRRREKSAMRYEKPASRLCACWPSCNASSAIRSPSANSPWKMAKVECITTLYHCSEGCFSCSASARRSSAARSTAATSPSDSATHQRSRQASRARSALRLLCSRVTSSRSSPALPARVPGCREGLRARNPACPGHEAGAISTLTAERRSRLERGLVAKGSRQACERFTLSPARSRQSFERSSSSGQARGRFRAEHGNLPP